MEEIATAINECKRQADAERAEVVKAQANINAEAGVPFCLLDYLPSYSVVGALA